jgi:hypothetical protein
MLSVAGVYLEDVKRCQVPLNPGCGGHGKLQFDVFISGKPLFPYVHQDIFMIFCHRFICINSGLKSIFKSLLPP